MGLGESYIERYLSKEHAYGNTCSGFSNNYVWTAVHTVKGTRKISNLPNFQYRWCLALYPITL